MSSVEFNCPRRSRWLVQYREYFDKRRNEAALTA